MDERYEEARRRAFDNLTSVADDLRLFVTGEADEDEYGTPEEYGLDWERQVRDYVAGTVTYGHLLMTGGPGAEVRVTFDVETCEVRSVAYSYSWGDELVTIPEQEMPHGAADALRNYYATYYADLVAED